MSVVTISRELGSGGDRLAARLAATLGYELMDSRLVDDVARITGASREEVARFDEKGEGRIACFLRRLLVSPSGIAPAPVRTSGFLPEFGLEFPCLVDDRLHSSAPYLDRGTYQLLITTLVQDAGAAGDVVVVGRASQVILGTRADGVHIKVVADPAWRCRRLAQSLAVSAEAAAQLVAQHDRWRQLYLLNAYGVHWDDPLLYDLVIHMGWVTAEQALELIAGLIRRRHGSHAPERRHPLAKGDAG